MMKNNPWKTSFLFLMIILCVIISGIIISGYNNPSSNNLENIEEFLDLIMEYISENHPEVSVYIKDDMSWEKIDETINIGYAEYNYSSEGWNVTIGHASTEEKFYDLRAEYEDKVIWKGTLKDGEINETLFNIIQSEEVDMSSGLNEFEANNKSDDTDIKILVLKYVIENHPEVIEYIEDPCEMVWTRNMTVRRFGYSEFGYTSNGWNMTIGYTTSADIKTTYEIRLENTREEIMWKGTVYNGTVTESSYRFKEG
jgi:hypothetical protein